jgi:hypothetical protein
MSFCLFLKPLVFLLVSINALTKHDLSKIPLNDQYTTISVHAQSVLMRLL